MLAVNMEEARDHVRPWVQSRTLGMDILLDLSGDATTAWRVTHTPMVFLVGRDGRLAAGGIGSRAWTGPAARAVLEALLAP